MLALLAACSPPDGLRPTPEGSGPVVVIDWDAEPLPELPFPNDLATRTDPTSPTGLRLNIPTVATTRFETETRERIDRLTGFGIYMPITVAFDAPLDLDAIALHHRDDPRLGADRFLDDLVYVIDVDPDSPGFLRPVALDLGEGRFPMDVPDPARYFPNDARADSPSIVFDTVDEDLDGDGELDWGEDTDNDGILDVPNVYPEGGDPREDLLTFYERATDTLILRPVLPLREETTYAVVLTERLVGTGGQPVRSPWPWVNHTRQTDALSPLEEALPPLGLTVDDVAFAWTFTTGRQGGILADLVAGLHGDGPFAWVGAQVPAAIEEALPVHDNPSFGDPRRLPVAEVVGLLVDLGFFDESGGKVIVDNYDAFASDFVGGSFTTPYLLVDKDDGGADDSDEWWDAEDDGSATVGTQRVPFTCILPDPEVAGPQPWPVVLFGHGYGSSRFDSVGFAHAFNRVGFAACAMDFPGHGPTLDPEDADLVEGILAPLGLLPFLDHLRDSRQRDLDNDGLPESGGDQWSADAFHTRDMVRQAALDWAQWVLALWACGTGRMDVVGVDGTVEGSATSCDWDGDGTPDIGAGAPIRLVGGSLGGINAAVAGPVIPEIDTVVPIVPGAGLVDTAMRTEISGAVEAMIGRLLSPMILGLPGEDGGLDVVQLVNSVTEMVELPIGHLDAVPADGRVIVENLTLGEVREGWIPPDGAFRVSIPADAADAHEKAELAGIPASGPEEGVAYTVPDNEGLGDRLRVTIEDAGGNLVASFATFPEDVIFQGVTYRAGSPLVAGAEGSGYIRATPDLRRVAGFFGAILEPGDPITYARRFFQEPFPQLRGGETRVLVVPTPGDMIVPINTGIALARAAGIIPVDELDDRYGTSPDRFLVETEVVRGLEEFGPWRSSLDGVTPVLFDADDPDEGIDPYGEPSEEPLRLEVTNGHGVSGLRLPYADPTGSHGFGLPDPDLAFDINTYAINQVVRYCMTAGAEILDHPCLEDSSCAWLPPLPVDGGSR